MKTFLNTSVALGILFAEPAMTYPTASTGALAMHRAHPNQNAKALAPLSATSAAAAPYSAHQTEGLSRNPGDCSRYGCIDEGGA
jgi:hypothetical protein